MEDPVSQSFRNQRNWVFLLLCLMPCCWAHSTRVWSAETAIRTLHVLRPDRKKEAKTGQDPLTRRSPKNGNNRGLSSRHGRKHPKSSLYCTCYGILQSQCNPYAPESDLTKTPVDDWIVPNAALCHVTPGCAQPP